MLSLFKTTAFDATEVLINKALSHDAASARELASLEGNVMLIQSSLPPIEIAVEITSTGIKMHKQWDGDTNVQIKGTLVAMGAVALNSKDTGSLSGAGIKVGGDLDTLNKLNTIMGQIDVDWEAALAGVVGDIPARILAQSIRQSAEFSVSALQRLSTGAVEAAQEEFRLTPNKHEFESTTQIIRQLASDVDRLEAKFMRLKQKFEQQPQRPSS
ncbi:MAG: hypothetical protein P8Q37_09575 [Porticoccaceae bacterium]|nr:hypothetical protein [Porticoccaceae bacterium]MDG1475145.1 hypothetical protein [Porticoccaceae bacterium]